jgi:hypothetical protein
MKKLIVIFAMVLMSQMVKGQMSSVFADTTKDVFALDTANVDYMLDEKRLNGYVNTITNTMYTLDLDSSSYLVPIKMGKLITQYDILNRKYTKLDEKKYEQIIYGRRFTATICSFPDDKNYFYILLAQEK